MILKRTYTQEETLRMAEALDRVHEALVISPKRRRHGRVFVDQLLAISDMVVLDSIVRAARRAS